MDSSQFDDMVRSVMSSRRSVLSGSLAVLSGWFGVSGTEAKKKRKHKKRKKRKPKARPNAFGCLEVGDPCTSEEQCCSGICDGKQGKKTCRAHDTGTCNQTSEAFCDPDNPTIALCNSASCVCVRTTAGSNFCTSTQGVQCADCMKDADCEALGFLPGSACLPWSAGQCADDCGETGMACAVPCGAEITGPIS